MSITQEDKKIVINKIKEIYSQDQILSPSKIQRECSFKYSQVIEVLKVLEKEKVVSSEINDFGRRKIL